MNRLSFNQKKPPTGELKKIIDNSSKVLVLSHIDPDGDALGTQLAFARYLKDIGKDVTLVRQSDIPEKYHFLSSVLDISHFDSLSKDLQFDTAIVLECPDFKRIGLAGCWITENTTVINIDHHRDNDLQMTLNWLNIEASSVGEMVYEYFEEVDYAITQDTAVCLYTAILTDTGRFRYNVTSQRTHEIAGKLITLGVIPQLVCDEIYFNMKPSTVILLGKVLNEIEFYHKGKLCMLTLTKEMLRVAQAESAESDGLVDHTLYNKGVEVGILIKEFSDSQTKVSMRSRDLINVSAIANNFGGGGHFNASGCMIEKSFDETKALLVEIFKEALHVK